MSLPWKRLIRFRTPDGCILHGEPILPVERTIDLGLVTEADQLQARVIRGLDIYNVTGETRVTDEVVTVKQILSPLGPNDVPLSGCVGLNYAKYIKEARWKPPPFPFIFFKPNTSVNDHSEPIVIPRILQNDQADYKGELCLVIGKDAKDISEEHALEYVAAYTVGNDISSCKLQRDPLYAVVVPQWGFSKGFDTFAPLGPVLVAVTEIPDLSELHLKATVDEEVRQDEIMSDLLFDCRFLISYLSQGTPLQKGSVIVTGTPIGVGAGLKPPR